MSENQTVILVVMFATVVMLLFMIYKEVLRREQLSLARNEDGRLSLEG